MRRSDLLEGLGSFGDHAGTEAEFRRRVGAWFASFEGLRSSGPTELEYERHVFERDDPTWAHRYADEAWSCALHYRACLRDLGVPHPLVEQPYKGRVGMAVADVAVVARAFWALREHGALATYEPQAGDALCSLGRSGPHVSCVVSAVWQEGAKLVLECVDGGQGRKGDMAIERNVYLFERAQRGTSLRSVEGPARSLDDPGPANPVLWGADLWALVLNAGLLSA